jgi:non-ribosomal peptide synthetase component F
MSPEREVFQAALVVENFPLEIPGGGASGALRVTSFADTQITHFPLTLAVLPGETTTIEASFDPARYDAATIDRLLACLRRALEGLGTCRRVGDIALLDPEATATSLAAGRGETLPPPPVANVLALVDWARFPALGRRVAAVAAALSDDADDAPVALVLPRGDGLNAALLGVWAAGRTALPLDPALPEDRLRLILADSGARRALLAATDAREAFAAIRRIDPAALPDAGAAPPPSAAAGTAYIFYTSGSTGTPKGVAVGHAALLNHAATMAAAYA